MGANKTSLGPSVLSHPLSLSGAMFSFSQLLSLLQGEPGLAEKIDISSVTRFIHMATTLKPDILHYQLPSFDPKDVPRDLPDNIATYLAAQLALNIEDTQALWRVFGVEVWIQGVKVLQEDQRFREPETSDPRFGMFFLASATALYQSG